MTNKIRKQKKKKVEPAIGVFVGRYGMGRDCKMI